MPYRYVASWQRACPERLSVYALHRYPVSSEERRSRAFTIGTASGSRLLTLRDTLHKMVESHQHRRRGEGTFIDFGEDDEGAYRLGLAASLLMRAGDPWEMERGVRYVLNATSEEVWFWTSKFLDDNVGGNALDALALMAGLRNHRQNLLGSE